MVDGMCPANRPKAAARWRLPGLAACLALLAGCGAFAPPPPPRPVVVQRPAVRPAPRAIPRPVVPQPDLPAAEQPAPAPAALPSLIRMPAREVEAMLGAPESRVASGAGERWRYLGPGCTLDLFLFPDVGSGGLVVLDRRASGMGEQDCLRRMRDGA
jgi:hypothetical protein